MFAIITTRLHVLNEQKGKDIRALERWTRKIGVFRADNEKRFETIRQLHLSKEKKKPISTFRSRDKRKKEIKSNCTIEISLKKEKRKEPSKKWCMNNIPFISTRKLFHAWMKKLEWPARWRRRIPALAITKKYPLGIEQRVTRPSDANQLPVNNKIVEESVKWCLRIVKPQSRSKFLSPSFSRIFPPFHRAEPDFTRSICPDIAVPVILTLFQRSWKSSGSLSISDE